MIHRSAIVGSLFGGVLLLLCPAARAAQPCTSNCATVTVGDVGEVKQGATKAIPISFTQAPSDGEDDRGNDDVAALALTVGIPGTGSGSPLILADCGDANGDGVPDAVMVSDELSGFKIVVENADCTNRTRCLCPSGTQTRDDFINIVVYGPKDLSAPVDIPRLPSGKLMDILLRVAGDAPTGPMPLHVYAQTDSGVEKPSFAAQLSIGDKSAIDQTCQGNCAEPDDVSKVAIEDGEIIIQEGMRCVGDCNGDGKVSTDELVLAVNITLGLKPMSLCPAIDGDDSGGPTVDELVNSVDNALNDTCH